MNIAVITCDVLTEEIQHFCKQIPQVKNVVIMEQGLHNTPDVLRERLQEAITAAEGDAEIDAIVLGYGLCSRGIEGVCAHRCTLVSARAHDCITLLLGSKERYSKYIQDHPGTYWYSAGWNRCHVPPGKERYENMRRHYVENYGEENADYLMEMEQDWMRAYNRAAFVNLGAMPAEADIEYTKQCAQWLKWDYATENGDPKLLCDLLSGVWDDERFLVLKPGETFRFTANDAILAPAPCQHCTGGNPLPQPAVSARRTTLDVTTLHGKQTILPRAHDPRVLSEFFAKHRITLNTRCSGHGVCKGCTLRLDEGELLDLESGNKITAPREVLSCQVEYIEGVHTSITIPDRSLMAHHPVVEDDFKIRVPVGEKPLFAGKYGFAVDIGTTTVVVLLADLSTGRILSRASSFNQQIRFGDDVLTRIQICQNNPGMVGQLQNAICRETILPLAREASEKAGISMEQVSGMCISGNTTMLHLLFGYDPTPLGFVPFTPHFLDHQVRKFGELGICEAPDLPIHVLPGLSAYVGADISAGIFATGLHYETEPMLLVDVGTNGEIVLRKEGKLYACATAAGPAFEGSGLSCGMRATQGAIEKISITAGLDFTFCVLAETIGKQPVEQASGICGSAYIDFLAQARTAGVLMENGRFNSERMANNPGAFFKATNGFGLRLHNGNNPASITETDIALLLQAKAAIAAGIETLLELEGLKPGDIKKLFLAGGFGMHMNIPHAIQCGLLPGFAPEQVEAVGNTALGGAYLAMLDESVIDELDHIREQVEVIELNLDPGFEDRYIDHLRLP